MNNKYFTIITFYQFKIIKDKSNIITKLKDFCKEDSWVTIETHVGDEKGKFGRILANIWLEETNVNQWLIDNKYAVAYFGQSKDDIEKTSQ